MSGFFEPRTFDSQVNVHPWTGANARYGPPQIRLFESDSDKIIAARVNEFLARPDVAVLGISPVALAMDGAAYHDAGVIQYVYTLTVIFQTRLLPNGGEDAEGGEL